jgi:hypothetical protein
MRSASNLFVLVLGCVVFGDGLAMAADQPGSKPSRTEEFVFGDFECRSFVSPNFDETGDVSFSFDASAETSLPGYLSS